ncbi:hypothetical protein STVA_18310 [Allostella vacuolata]|nr:hypothetical protein STVA_18310 [Stella vacuolata]
MPYLRIAAFQRRPVFDALPVVTHALANDLAWAASQGAQLALFPECYLQGYATDRPTLERRALPVADASIAALVRRLGETGVTTIVGMIERRGEALFNTALVVGHRRLLGTYSKIHPNEDGVSPGTDCPVFVAGTWPFAVNICNDANFPETALRAAAAGARLICYPLNNLLRPPVADRWRARSVQNLQARAVETGCWIASADVVGEHGGRVSFGCTLIVRPDGEIVARAAEGREGVALFDLA